MVMVAIDDPVTYKQAMECPEKEHWERAIYEELDSIETNKKWTKTKFPLGKEAIRCKVIFKQKIDEVGRAAR